MTERELATLIINDRELSSIEQTIEKLTAYFQENPKEFQETLELNDLE